MPALRPADAASADVRTPRLRQGVPQSPQRCRVLLSCVRQGHGPAGTQGTRAEGGIVTALYWIFDATGMLIYVGVTDDPAERFGRHASTALWWPLAARHEVQWYRVREDAETAERAAIKRYDPYFNRAHAINPIGNPAFNAGIKSLCQEVGVSRSMLVTLLLDRELAARGLLGADPPCYHSMLGWPDAITAGLPDGQPCGCGRPMEQAACGTYVGTTTGDQR